VVAGHALDERVSKGAGMTVTRSRSGRGHGGRLGATRRMRDAHTVLWLARRLWRPVASELLRDRRSRRPARRARSRPRIARRTARRFGRTR
jgi:hypothetical protein